MMQPLWKIIWKFLKKLKIDLPYDPAIPLLDIYFKTTKALSRRDIHTPMFTAALLTTAKTRKQLSVHRQINGYSFVTKF